MYTREKSNEISGVCLGKREKVLDPINWSQSSL